MCAWSGDGEGAALSVVALLTSLSLLLSRYHSMMITTADVISASAFVRPLDSPSVGLRGGGFTGEGGIGGTGTAGRPTDRPDDPSFVFSSRSSLTPR